MWATEQNDKTARAIINLFSEKEYTVAEAKEILRFVELKISSDATVQTVNGPFFDYPGAIGFVKPFVMKIDGDTSIKIDGVELARVAKMLPRDLQG